MSFSLGEERLGDSLAPIRPLKEKCRLFRRYRHLRRDQRERQKMSSWRHRRKRWPGRHNWQCLRCECPVSTNKSQTREDERGMQTWDSQVFMPTSPKTATLLSNVDPVMIQLLATPMKMAPPFCKVHQKAEKEQGEQRKTWLVRNVSFNPACARL